MIITASKKDDILRRKAEYDARKAEYDAESERIDREYQSAEDAILDPIREELRNGLGHFSMLQPDIQVDRSFAFSDKGIRVRISCNEHDRSPDTALWWSYIALLDDSGEVRRETSSWSGLNATTEGQMKYLRQTVSALEYLNDLDWERIVKTPLPDARHYYPRDRKAPEREDFESQLLEAELEDLIGANKLIQVRNFESSGYRGDRLYVKILRETPSQYEVVVVPAYSVMRMTPDDLREHMKTHTYSQRVRKSNIRPIQPLDIKEL